MIIKVSIPNRFQFKTLPVSGLCWFKNRGKFIISEGQISFRRLWRPRRKAG